MPYSVFGYVSCK